MASHTRVTRPAREKGLGFRRMDGYVGSGQVASQQFAVQDLAHGAQPQVARSLVAKLASDNEQGEFAAQRLCCVESRSSDGREVLPRFPRPTVGGKDQDGGVVCDAQRGARQRLLWGRNTSRSTP